MEPFRDYFCLDVPTPDFLRQEQEQEQGRSRSRRCPPSTTMSCVKVILQSVQAVPGLLTGLAVLMNASRLHRGSATRNRGRYGESAMAGLTAVAAGEQGDDGVTAA